jgi:hypothetical protein
MLHTGILLRHLLDDHVELLALDPSYSDRLRFIGLQVGVVLEPATMSSGASTTFGVPVLVGS